MLIEIKKIKSTYQRESKLHILHTYKRTKTVIVFRCDSCGNIFEREQGKMSRKRISHDYVHVCPNCDTKKFAQRRGVERRQVWKLSADSDIDITKI